MGVLLIQIVLTLLASWLDAWWDARRWKEGEKIYHFWEFLLRVFVVWCISWFNLKLTILLGAIFWIPFELILYKYMGLPWHHVGTTDGVDQFWRKLFKKDTGKWLMGVKIAVLVIAIVINLI